MPERDYRRAGTVEDEHGVQPVTSNQQPFLIRNHAARGTIEDENML